MNIAVFCWRDHLNPKAGGAERVMLKHALYWISKGHNVTFFSSEISHRPKQLIDKGIIIHRVGNEKTFFLTAGLLYLTQTLFHKNHFDIVIDQIHGIPSCLPLIRGNRKTIALIHEVAGDIWNYMFPWPLSVIGKFIEKIMIQKAYQNTLFWVDSQSTQKDLQKLGIIVSNINVIPCAIDSIQTKASIEKSQNLQLIFLSRIVRMKGIEYALQVMRYLALHNKDSRLLVVGSGEKKYINEIKKKIVDLGIDKNVIFEGKVSETKKMRLLAKSHFLLHTSVKEGFGLTVLESYSEYTPVAIFDVGSLNELVIDNKTGVIAPFHDESELAIKIYDIYENKENYNKMCHDAHRFGEKFSWEKFTKISLNLLEAL